jgi:ribosomal protein S18 acetylase RimI-like enzyme
MSKKVYIDMESFEKRLRSDQTCYMALDQGKIIYFVWVSSSDVPKTVTSHVVKLKPQEVCMYHAFCLPEYRRKRIHSSIMSIRLKELQEKSFDNAKVDCRINNLPQIKTLLRHGFVPHRMVWVMTIAGMRFHYSFKQSNIYPIKWTQG